jgi:fructose-1,6-bisphosphatase-3
MDERRLLHRINRGAGTIEVDGQIYRLKSAYFPTIDPVQPYKLAPEERICLERIRSSFLASHKLSQQMRWMVSHGRMCLRRD